MKLLQYIQGNRKGKEINRLEKEAMKDPFLADALEGFNKVADNHELRIEELREKVLYKTKSRKNHIVRYVSLAASILLIIGLGGYFLLNNNDIQLEMAKNLSEPKSEMRVSEEQIVENEPLQENHLPDMTKQTGETLFAEIKTKKKNEIPPVVAKDHHKVIDDEKSIESELFKESQTAQAIIPDTVVQAEIIIPDKEDVGKVRGIITDSEGEPLSGVSIKYLGTNTGTISDINGYFELAGSNENNIQISSVGYESKRLVADTDTMMLVAMTEAAESLSETAIVAFGIQKRESIVGSISAEKMENIKPQPDMGKKAYEKYLNKDIKPEPVIGKKAYEKYLKANIVKPQNNGCKGKVKLKFSINMKGRPVNIRVEKSLCPEADTEAIRLINLGPDWTVGDKDVEITVKF
jgi:hypothetical protein